MNKKIILVLATIMILAMANAQMMLAAQSSADCSTFSDNDFQALGDKWMDQMMGEQAHQAMEARIGAPASDTMNLRMGKSITGCLSQNELNNYQGYYGMIGGTIGYSGMMNNYGINPIWIWAWWIIIALSIIALILLIIYLGKKITKKKKR